MNETMNNVDQVLLPILVLMPFLTGFLCWVAEKIHSHLPRWVGLVGMVITFAIVVFMWQEAGFTGASQDFINTNTLPQWIAEYQRQWIPALGISLHFAMDGFSLLLVGLTALLGIMAVGCSWREIQKNGGFFYLNLLWSLGGVIGVFLAIDMFLFFFFWEMMLVPIYFLIALWGHRGSSGKSRVYAATKFFIYTQASGLVMLIGILAMVMINYTQTNQFSFNYMDLIGTQLGSWEYPLMLCFFIGFAVKLPIMPFHGWLPDAHAQAPTAGSVDLAGILIKTAAYGLVRFVLPFFPEASHEFAPIAMTLGTIGVFYAAWLAFMQTDIKRLLAYTSISHMGFVVVAIYAGTLMSLQGVTMQMLAHGLSSAALFIMCGQLYERMHTRDLRKMGGMWGQLRYLAPFLMFFSAALLGIPGTGNFVGEFVILLGSFGQYPVFVVLLTVSLVFAGLYALILIHQALFGEVKQTEHLDENSQTHVKLADLSLREKLILLTLATGLLWLGLYPQPVMDTAHHSVQWISEVYHYGATLSANTQPILPSDIASQAEVASQMEIVK